MTRMTLALAVVFGLSASAVSAQDTGGPPERGGRPQQRERGSGGAPGAEFQRLPASPVIAALDANGDGVIDADELSGSSGSLKKLDRNGDGKLTADELRPDRPGGSDGPGGPPGDRARGGQSGFETSPLAGDESEKKILAVLEEMNRGAGRGMMSVPQDDGRFLRLLTESVRAKNVVEIGTSHGYSAIWLCLALRATGGRLTTYEIDRERAALARENFQRAGVDSIATLVEGDAHQEVPKLKDPIDLLFLDADKEGYLDYLNKLLPLVRPGGLIVAHNMSARQADPAYVNAITTNPNLETLFVNLGSSGIGVTLKKR